MPRWLAGLLGCGGLLLVAVAAVVVCGGLFWLYNNPRPVAPPPPPPVAPTGGFPATVDEVYNLVARPCAGSDCLNLERSEIHPCPGEANCFAIAREKDLNARIIPFMGVNPSSCMQDGWMHSDGDRNALGRQSPPSAVGSGVPSGYTGLLEGMVLRPCS